MGVPHVGEEILRCKERSIQNEQDSRLRTGSPLKFTGIFSALNPLKEIERACIIGFLISYYTESK